MENYFFKNALSTAILCVKPYKFYSLNAELNNVENDSFKREIISSISS